MPAQMVMSLLYMASARPLLRKAAVRVACPVACKNFQSAGSLHQCNACSRSPHSASTHSSLSWEFGRLSSLLYPHQTRVHWNKTMHLPLSVLGATLAESLAKKPKAHGT